MNIDKLKSISFRLCIHGLLALAIALCLMLPALIFNSFSPSNVIWFSEKYYWIFFGFALLLAACRSHTFIAVVLGLLCLLEITQFASLAYFGDYINPFWIHQMFIEAADVSQEALASTKNLYFVPLSALLPYASAFLLIYATKKARFKLPFMTILVALILIFPGIRMKVHSDSDDIFSFFPVISDPSLANSLQSYYAWLNFILIPGQDTENLPEFPPYQTENIPLLHEKMNVVVVMGESATPNHMSLYGYPRKTTPNLDALAAETDQLITKLGISAANATRSALPAFYTAQYHPLDTKPVQNQNTNLFTLAKKQGFKTFYISAQNINCLNGVNTKDIDFIAAFDHHRSLFSRKKDDGIIELLHQLELSDKNFIILHQRNSHSPYAVNYSHRPEFDVFSSENPTREQNHIDTYDNSILYSDWLYDEVIKYFKTMPESPPSYIFITSDHGEMFGENGLWGHNHMDMENFKVPLIYYGIHADPGFTGKIREEKVITHYQLSLYTAELLGTRIINPGEEEGIFYVNGVAAFGRSGYLRFRITEEGSIEEIELMR
ncbi:phosphoethanolamine transferase [Desulfobotulus mexicanus]|uniref:Phosphoethanolamine transferase n=1 Tax=Desulfobotulus mexicanus TaxID=2586642 RepID=A0A5Q4VAS2_9BACT|nr:phosphoethanolamine transferase [Desulfobotulus mexicanus]TYT74854.1 phosphoethanolamine transferase [Desulfobotulus mexicanus]